MLWWCLKPGTQVLLMQFQWDNFGFKVEIPPCLEGIDDIETKLETLEEINRLKKVGARYGRLPKHLRDKG